MGYCRFIHEFVKNRRLEVICSPSTSRTLSTEASSLEHFLQELKEWLWDFALMANSKPRVLVQDSTPADELTRLLPWSRLKVEEYYVRKSHLPCATHHVTSKR